MAAGDDYTCRADRDEGQTDAIDKRLREAHRDLTEDLRDVLDIEAGLRDVLDRAKRDG